ncbi:protein TPRXL [Microbacterium invictum]|uniref:Protein TPRXL n=1 Tax=Microbacterium invictum TaxID=515415 RepID=A0AA40SPK4_9MICO|nr:MULTISPECIES: protein TPRXL [Microbacterium]MBB4139902.1 hypothetical protein [Microbacterium invictum]
MNDAKPGPDDLNPQPERLSLREQLGGTPDPLFEITLPTGWVRRDANSAQREELRAAMRDRLMRAHRPDLLARVQPLVDDAFDKMAKESVIAFFTPETGDDDALALPASLVASLRHAPVPGENLDPLIRSLIREAGATPLLGDKRFLRFERETTQKMDDGEFRQTNVVYLTPVPGSDHKRALQLTATIVRPVDAPADDRPFVLMRALFDLCVSTVAWKPAVAATA